MTVGGTVSVDAGGNVNFDRLAVAGNVDIDAGGNVFSNFGDDILGSTLNVNAGGSIDLASGATINRGGNITLTAGNDVRISRNVDIIGAGNNLTLNAGANIEIGESTKAAAFIGLSTSNPLNANVTLDAKNNRYLR